MITSNIFPAILISFHKTITNHTAHTVLSWPLVEQIIAYFGRIIWITIQATDLEVILKWLHVLNSSPPGQNGCHFTDNIFRCIFCEWKDLYFEGLIDNSRRTREFHSLDANSLIFVSNRQWYVMDFDFDCRCGSHFGVIASCFEGLIMWIHHSLSVCFRKDMLFN